MFTGNHILTNPYKNLLEKVLHAKIRNVPHLLQATAGNWPKKTLQQIAKLM